MTKIKNSNNKIDFDLKPYSDNLHNFQILDLPHKHLNGVKLKRVTRSFDLLYREEGACPPEFVNFNCLRGRFNFVNAFH